MAYSVVVLTGRGVVVIGTLHEVVVTRRELAMMTWIGRDARLRDVQWSIQDVEWSIPDLFRSGRDIE